MDHSGDTSTADRDRILEVAAADPDASPAELAEQLSDVPQGAIERVLEERDRSDPGAEAGKDASNGDYPNPENISERQRKTLQAIAAHPDATQRDIASFLDVTAATVSNRVNSLPGFEWDERRQFVTEVLDLDSIPGSDRSSVGDVRAVELSETVQNLVDRVEALEQQVDSLAAEAPDDSGTPFDDPELTRKVIHVCMDAAEITDDEEKRILEYFLEQ